MHPDHFPSSFLSDFKFENVSCFDSETSGVYKCSKYKYKQDNWKNLKHKTAKTQIQLLFTKQPIRYISFLEFMRNEVWKLLALDDT